MKSVTIRLREICCSQAYRNLYTTWHLLRRDALTRKACGSDHLRDLFLAVRQSVESARSELLASANLGCKPELLVASFDRQLEQQMPLYCKIAAEMLLPVQPLRSG